MLLLRNVVAFKLAWATSVIGAAQQMPWLGPVAVMAALVMHAFAARHPRRELLLVLSCGLIGASFDSLLLAMGWVSYSSGLISEVVAPYWIVTMWMLFATTLNVSMRWLRNREVVATLLGLFGGPLAYLAGQKMGGIILVEQTAALVALGLGWAIMMPLLVRIAEHFDGFGHGHSQSIDAEQAA